MKRTFKKIFASIMTIALISSVCTIAPVMAEGEITATTMEFIDADQAWWTDAVHTSIASETGGTLNAKRTLGKSTALHYQYFDETIPNTAYTYGMETEGGFLVVPIPAKEGYNIKTVGVTVTMDTSAVSTQASDYLNIFNYAYSTDGGETWENILNPTYTDYGVATLYNGRWQVFCEVLKVPANATHVKITRNAVDAKYGSNSKYDGVCGVQFGYMPAEMGDVLEFDAGNNEKVIDFINSGIIADGAFGWNSYAKDIDDDGVAEYGFAVAFGESVTIEAIEGYKIKSVSGTFGTDNLNRSRAEIVLGESIWASSADDGVQNFSVTNASGADKLVIRGTKAEAIENSGQSKWTICGLTVVMEKDVEELAMTVTGAVKSEESVDVSLQVTGRASAEVASMKLLVVGYAGDVMSDVKILTVSKTDTSDEYSTSLSADTTSVRAFLWKDLSTLVPILPATTAFPVG